MAKLIGDQMTNVIVQLVLPFQWGLGGAYAEPATKLGTVSPLVGRTAPDQLVDCALGFWIEIPLYYF